MKKKFLINFLIIASVGITPLLTISIIGLNQENKYGETFYAGLKVKDERLTKVEDKKKIIFVGGSSLSFGLRSDLLTDALGYEVVNYGLYAPLGTKTMSELVKNKINEDDVIIFTPELSKETYSTNINYSMLHKCFENTKQFDNRLSLDDKMMMLFNYPSFVFERFGAEVEITPPYDLASFNEYGDISNDIVKKNILSEYYDSSQMIEPCTSLLDKDFIKYLNSYSKIVSSKKAKIYFTFSPTNKLSLVEDNIKEFEDKLQEELDFKVLGSVKDYTYHENYFYDTNYHLNYAGSIIHSKKLFSILDEELNIKSSYSFPEAGMPNPKFEEEVPYDPISDSSFTINKKGDDYFLVKVDDSIKDKQVIRVPESIDGNIISGISRDAFKDFTNLKYVILPSKINNLDNSIFNNCTSLERIYLTNEIAPGVVGNGLLDNCNPNVKIYILKKASQTYNLGYTWINYKKYFVSYNIEDIKQYMI